jgi:PAS domain S-box-containing protein
MLNDLNIFSANDRRVTAFWLVMWLLLVGVMLLAVKRESEHQLSAHMTVFEKQTLDLSEIAEQIIVSRLERYDEVLLVLREAFVADRRSFPKVVRQLRNGPLADPDVLVVQVDSDGHLGFTDAPGAQPRLYLGDQPYFRYFAGGGKDSFFVDEPRFGRATRRYTVPLVRPILDRQGAFLGVVAISIKHEALRNFGHALTLPGTTTVSVVHQSGAFVTRSRDLARVQGTTLAPELLAPLLKGSEGVYTLPGATDGDTHTIAYQHPRGLPLIVFADAYPVDVLADVAKERNLLLASAGFVALLVLALLLGLLQRRKVLTRFITLQQTHLQEAQRIAGMGSWELDLASSRFKWSDEVYRLFGLEREGFDPGLDNFLALVCDADRAAVKAEIDKAITEGRGEIEFGLIRGDGQLRSMFGHGESVSDNANKVVALIGTVRDVTDQRAAEKALMESEALFRTLAHVLPVGIVRTDDKANCVYVNERYCEIAGQTFEEALDKGWTARIHPDDRARVFAEGARAAETGTAFSSEYRLVRPAGDELWILAQAQQETNAQGEVVGYVGSVTDITVHKQAVEMAYRLILRNQVLMQNAMDGIHILDEHGQVQEANLAFCALLGYTPAEVQLLNVADWEAKFTGDELKRSLATLMDGGQAVFETINRRKDGSLINVEISAVGIELDGKKLLYAASRDITERKQIQQGLEGLVAQRTAELTAALEAARVADRSKDAFLANITHELRTPLSAVIGFSSLARPLATDPRQRDYLDKVNSAGKTLAGIIDDLLDLSKIVAGRMEFEVLVFSLRQLVERSRSVIGFRAKEKGLQLLARIDDEVPDVLVGDTLRLEQIMLNLLSNAVKFTAAGRVELRVGLISREAQRVCLKVEVEDTGIGLSEEGIALLFKPFSQTDASMTRKFGGTGLGLAICKRLAEMMDGEISVTSREGSGTTFCVKLWLGLGEAKDLPAVETIGPEAMRVRYQDVRVLVVDDQPFNRDIVEGLLAVVGITPQLAEDGRQAFDILAGDDSRFDLVLMDIQMPVMDGLTATRAIRSLDALADLPIIAMTAHTMAHEKDQSADAGMNDHIGKPFDEVAFYSVLAKWIPRSKQHFLSIATARPVSANGLPLLNGVDTEAGLALLLGDEARYRHWLNDFVVEAPVAMKQIRVALAVGQAAPASMAAHTLKGRMGLLGMKELHALAAELEAAIDGGAPASELLLDLERGVAVMCAEIRSGLGQEASAAPAAGGVVDVLPAGVPHGPPPATVAQLIERLNAGDSDCDRIIDDCLAELKHTPWAPHLRQAQVHVQNFDYAAASSVLGKGGQQ